jgi:hypothetical protein
MRPPPARAPWEPPGDGSPQLPPPLLAPPASSAIEDSPVPRRRPRSCSGAGGCTLSGDGVPGVRRARAVPPGPPPPRAGLSDSVPRRTTQRRPSKARVTPTSSPSRASSNSPVRLMTSCTPHQPAASNAAARSPKRRALAAAAEAAPLAAVASEGPPPSRERRPPGARAALPGCCSCCCCRHCRRCCCCCCCCCCDGGVQPLRPGELGSLLAGPLTAAACAAEALSAPRAATPRPKPQLHPRSCCGSQPSPRLAPTLALSLLKVLPPVRSRRRRRKLERRPTGSPPLASDAPPALPPARSGSAALHAPGPSRALPPPSWGKLPAREGRWAGGAVGPAPLQCASSAGQTAHGSSWDVPCTVFATTLFSALRGASSPTGTRCSHCWHHGGR